MNRRPFWMARVISPIPPESGETGAEWEKYLEKFWNDFYLSSLNIWVSELFPAETCFYNSLFLLVIASFKNKKHARSQQIGYYQ